MKTYVGDCSGGVIGGTLHDYRYAVRAIAFIYYFLEVFFFFGSGSFDCGFHTILGHVNAFGVLDGHSEPGVVIGIGPTLFYGYGNVFTDSRKGLGHTIEPGEHLVLSFFEYPTH